MPQKTDEIIMETAEVPAVQKTHPKSIKRGLIQWFNFSWLSLVWLLFSLWLFGFNPIDRLIVPVIPSKFHGAYQLCFWLVVILIMSFFFWFSPHTGKRLLKAFITFPFYVIFVYMPKALFKFFAVSFKSWMFFQRTLSPMRIMVLMHILFILVWVALYNSDTKMIIFICLGIQMILIVLHYIYRFIVSSGGLPIIERKGSFLSWLWENWKDKYLNSLVLENLQEASVSDKKQSFVNLWIFDCCLFWVGRYLTNEEKKFKRLLLGYFLFGAFNTIVLTVLSFAFMYYAVRTIYPMSLVLADDSAGFGFFDSFYFSGITFLGADDSSFKIGKMLIRSLYLSELFLSVSLLVILLFVFSTRAIPLHEEAVGRLGKIFLEAEVYTKKFMETKFGTSAEELYEIYWKKAFDSPSVPPWLRNFVSPKRGRFNEDGVYFPFMEK